MTVAQRLRDAMNAHDLEALLDCFAEDYRSQQPAHPNRGFGGRDQVRQNWSMVFRGVPNFTAELVREAAQDGVEWSEWRWTGDRVSGEPLAMAGVIVMEVRDGRVAAGSLYMETVETGGEDITGSMRKMTGDA